MKSFGLLASVTVKRPKLPMTRTHGLPQLKKQNCQQRFSDFSAAQIKALMVSLQARRNQYPKVTDDLLAVLAEIYKRMASHDR